MQGRTFEVNFSPIDQQTPATSSVPGQMRYIRNGQVSQFDERSIKIGKRNGFRQQTKNIRDVTNGANLGSAGFPSRASLFSSLGHEQVVVSDSHPYVLAEDEPSWSKFPYVYSPTVVTKRPVYTANTQIANPDGASIGNVFCRTWTEDPPNASPIRLVRALFTDSDGTPICGPITVNNSDVDTRAKVVSDGTVFWIIYTIFNHVIATVWDVHGVQLALLDTGLLNGAANPWDLTFQQGKVMVARNVPTDFDDIGIDVLSFDGVSTITHAFTNLSFTCLGNLGVAWAENRVADGFAYLLTSHYEPESFTPTEKAFQIGTISTTPTITHFYGIGNNSGSIIYGDDGFGDNTGLLTEMTGVNMSDGFHIQLSFVQSNGTRSAYGDHKLSRIVMLNASTASALPTVERVIPSIVSASRTFVIDGRSVELVYYTSGQPAIVFNPSSLAQQRYVPEPTYFLIDIVTGQVCGEFDWSNAAMEWSRNGYPEMIGGLEYGAFNFSVGHIFPDLDGNMHVSAAYQAQAINATVQTNDIFGPAVRLTSTVGFENIKFGGEGQAVEYASELLMPGPLSTSFTGYSFGENDLTLAPEQPVLVASHVGGTHLTLLGNYSYIYVFERTLPNGDRVRSSISVPQTVQLAGTEDTVTHTIFPLFMTTYSDVIISIYRNTINSDGTPNPIHHKVTDDLHPLWNNKVVHSISFVDNLPDATIAVNEVLYTDQGFVNRIPCPAFSVGCVFENRIIVYGLDGAIWFSGEKSEGDAIWFSDDPAFRIAMPTQDPVKNLIPVDGRIGILCESSQWAFTGGGFPGPNGLGANLQTPQVLPFNQGSTGFSETFPMGAVYSSSAGDAWIFTRGLENKHLGEKAIEDFRGRTITGICIDSKQRIGFLLMATDDLPSTFEVYDQVAQLWTTYELPTNGSDEFLALKAHSVRGSMSFTDSNSVWVQDNSIFIDIKVDAANLFIESSYQTEFINIGAVKNFQRIWDQIVTGEYKGPHTLQVTTVADSNGQDVSTVYNFTPNPTKPYCYSLPPVVEEASRVSFLFEDRFVEGDTFLIELISFYVAVGDGLSRLSPAQHISPALSPVSGTVTGSSNLVTVLRLNGAQDLKVLPGATTFTFPIGIPSGQGFTVSKLSGPGTVVSPSGTAGTVQVGTPVLSL